MKRQLKAWLPALVLTIALLAPLSLINAHHSFSPLLTKQGEQAIRIFEGSIELYKLLNPHSALIVNLYNENGTVDDWLVELINEDIQRIERDNAIRLFPRLGE